MIDGLNARVAKITSFSQFFGPGSIFENLGCPNASLRNLKTGV